jgi:hypothetical protein
MRKAFAGFFALILLMILAPAHAQEYEITLHEVHLQVNAEGNAKSVERFYLTFPNDAEKASFRNMSIKLGSDMEQWLQFNTKFQPNIKNPNTKTGNLSDKKISYNEGEQTYLEISYSLSDPLMAKRKETPTGTEFELKAVFLNNFFEFGLWVIPDKTKITIELPLDAEVRQPVEPPATVSQIGSKKVVQWQGYKSGNNLELKYVLWKQIALDFNLFSAISSLFFTPAGLTALAVLIAILAVVFISRKKIVKKIENFVANNSKLEEE